jgi:hypothetical protein
LHVHKKCMLHNIQPQTACYSLIHATYSVIVLFKTPFQVVSGTNVQSTVFLTFQYVCIKHICPRLSGGSPMRRLPLDDPAKE